MLEPPVISEALDYSVVIEWENVRLADTSRADEMFRRLGGQIRELGSRDVRGEVIAVRDGHLPDDGLDRLLARHLADHATPVRIVDAGGAPYYEKKNVGGRAAHGAIVVFLDSDVIPEERWLASLLAAFERPDVDVAAGSTYVDTSTFYSKAFALFWFFPLRAAEEGLVTADVLFGNNIAFRRKLFLENPFPSVEQFRGQCGMLIGDLRRRGAGIFLQRGSRCAHPPPNGLMHFVRRAMCDGHDNIIIWRRDTGTHVPWRHTYWAVRAWSQRFLSGIWSRYRDVGMTRAGAVGATMVALAYVACVTAGDLLTRVDPRIVRRRFGI